MLPVAVLVDLASELDRPATELRRMRSRHTDSLRAASTATLGVRRNGGTSNSHKTLVPQGLLCKSVTAGTYNFDALNNGIPTSSDNNDYGSITVYVYALTP